MLQMAYHVDRLVPKTIKEQESPLDDPGGRCTGISVPLRQQVLHFQVPRAIAAA